MIKIVLAHFHAQDSLWLGDLVIIHGIVIIETGQAPGANPDDIPCTVGRMNWAEF